MNIFYSLFIKGDIACNELSDNFYYVVWLLKRWLNLQWTIQWLCTLFDCSVDRLKWRTAKLECSFMWALLCKCYDPRQSRLLPWYRHSGASASERSETSRFLSLTANIVLRGGTLAVLFWLRRNISYIIITFKYQCTASSAIAKCIVLDNLSVVSRAAQFVLCFRKGLKWKRAILKTHRLIQGSNALCIYLSCKIVSPPIDIIRRNANRTFNDISN